jgi:EAL domain-containing protein (putative c-di-GMP-specific phosphodiesterase class I)/putative methionine-R-sulfoxide reductase with GAF domain
MAVVGYEALARMPIDPMRSPDWWLEQASIVGLRHELELACLRSAAALGDPPAGRALFVNASPSLVANPAVLELRDALPQRLVLELTEQEAVDDYERLREHLGGWLAGGVRLAVDDAGAGYSSLRHVVELGPDYLKVDRELVRDLDSDPTRQALLRAIVAFSHEVGTSVIAEGVETSAELTALRDAKVHLVQGFLLARPDGPWPSITRGAEQVWAPSMSDLSGDGSGFDRFEQLRLSLGRMNNVVEACETVVEDIFRHDRFMTSLYLERDQQLRCVAQRGLWQVLDGLPRSMGITGLTWAERKTIVVPEVSLHDRYLQAIPGVVAEICVPLMVNGDAVGALNVESLGPLFDGAPQGHRDCGGNTR